MKQYEAVIKVMEDNGGYATLGYLYQEVFKVPGVIWRSKTPFANIRRIVQDERFFFKIRPGLWALNSHKNILPEEILALRQKSKNEKNFFIHSCYQGLILEIGNLFENQTYIPNQDRRKKFLNKKLEEISTLKNIYPFSFDEIVKISKTIDVIWFNQRKMPKCFFEIEHSSDIKTSLLKFVELQDFHSKFVIVANEVRRNELEKNLNLSAFNEIKKRVEFWSYDFVSNLHAKTYEYYSIAGKINFY
ncbi:MAG: winged helix-turn-helix domain-containing protein [Ignavibacteria bacterium]|nr:winged helix-turn-helix domain-containing protein [Ignavibacteria bacterium]